MTNPIDTYIQDSPETIQPILDRVRELVLSIDPDLTQTLSYGMPTFKKNGKSVFRFAVHKNHLGIYPGTAAIVHFQDRLHELKHSKGAIQMPYALPLDLKLIEDILRFNLGNL